jgi:peroxiredoxin
MKTRLGLAALVPVAVLSSLVAAPSRAFAEGRDLRGSPAPEIYAQSGLNGLTGGTTLSRFRGRVVVIKFWFSGCPTCRGSLPEFQALYDRFASRGVQFIAAAYEDPGVVSSFLGSQRYTFPVVIDPSGIGPSRYGVVSYPTNYVIGADGIVKSYNDISPWVIEREVAASATVRNANELGEVPAAIAAAREAAQRNDYGEVLRVVEAHLDATKEPSVAPAARRVQALALQRFDNRIERIKARWATGDYVGAFQDVKRLASDFRGTSKSAWIASWIAMLVDVPQLKGKVSA